MHRLYANSLLQYKRDFHASKDSGVSRGPGTNLYCYQRTSAPKDSCTNSQGLV